MTTMHPMTNTPVVNASNVNAVNGDDSALLKTLLAQASTHRSAQDDVSSEDVLQFLHTEFNSLTELWKHTDSRLESGINLYFTSSTVIVSAIALFSQQFTDRTLFTFAALGIVMALAIIGFILSRRLLAALFMKAEYAHGRNLIRKFFAQKKPEVAQYLYFLDKDERKSPGAMFIVLHLWISLLVSLALSTLLYLFVLLSSFLVLIPTCITLFMTCYALLQYDHQRRAKAFDLTK